MANSRTRLEDLATIAGVSIATVSRALNNSSAVNDETKRRVWQIAREQNYNFRPSMPALMSGAAATIAVVIPTPFGRTTQAADPFFQELIGGITDAARDAGCDVLISHLAPKGVDDLTSLMTANRADGVIFIGQRALHEHFNNLAQTETKFIVWGAELPGQKYCCIGSDNIAGGRRAASHLLNMGRKRIAFIGDVASLEVQQRYEGYIEAHRRAGADIDHSLTLKANFEIESAEAALNTLLDRGIDFDGVFAASDLIGLGAIQGLRRAGLSVPDAVSVVGYDNLQVAAYSNPTLTTVSQDIAKAGRIMVSKLTSGGEGNKMRSERLPTELIMRESCSLA